jgi:hypothetical protein
MSRIRTRLLGGGTLAILATTQAFANPAATGPQPAVRVLDAAIKLRSVSVSPALAARLSGKPRADLRTLRSRLDVRAGQVFFQVRPGVSRPLDPRYDLLSTEQFFQELGMNTLMRAKASRAVTPYMPYVRGQSNPPLVPPQQVSLLARQTPVRDQLDRGTCVAFATTGALEAAYGRRFDFSEQSLYQAYQANLRSHECVNGAFVPGMMGTLQRVGITLEHLASYQTGSALRCPALRPESTVPDPVTNAEQLFSGSLPPMIGPNPAHRPWRVVDFGYSLGGAVDELSARQPRYLEAILASGREVVVGMGVADWTNIDKGPIDVRLDENGAPMGAVAGHAMLLVGYQRTGPDDGIFVLGP